MSLNSERTYVVTGAASGIGAATVRRLRADGVKVIGCDLTEAEVIGDLATPRGRAAVIEGVQALSGGRIDGLVANAGGGPAETMLALNYFGAVATLEGLRPLLAASPAPRAVAIASISVLGAVDADLAAACAVGDEARAIQAGQALLAAGASPLILYGSAKQALIRWCRTAAVTGDWAGAHIGLNVIAPGVIDTPAAAYLLSNPDLRAQMATMAPLTQAFPGQPDELAALIAWMVGPENRLMCGQVLFADAGFECMARGAASW